MSSLTPRFRLEYFGGPTPGTITANGQKYTSADRLTLDRLLAQVEGHDHLLRPPTGVLAVPSTAELTSGAGILPSGPTYYYRFSVVDENGMESVASPAVAVPTPALLATPGIPALDTDSGVVGTLPPGIYYYALTALRGAEETPLGSSAVISVIAGQTSVRLAFPAFGEADSFRVWRMGYNESGFTKLAVVATAEYVDDGSIPADSCACDPGNQPPQTNVGVANYGVVLTLPVAVDLTTARAWRVYRSASAASYPTASLVHEVVEREDEWNDETPLLRSWTDDGSALSIGKPQDADLNMRFAPFTFDTATVLPSPLLYPANYPIVVEGRLYAKVVDAWALVGGSGGAPAVLTSPDGSRFVLTVANTGALSTMTTLMPGPPAAPENVSVA